MESPFANPPCPYLELAMKSVSLWSSEFMPPSSELVSGDVEDAV